MKYLYSTYKFFQIILIFLITILLFDIGVFVSFETFIGNSLSVSTIFSRIGYGIYFSFPIITLATLIFTLIMTSNKEIEEEKYKRFIFILSYVFFIVGFSILNVIIKKNAFIENYDFLMKNEFLKSATNMYLFNTDIIKIDFFQFIEKSDIIKTIFDLNLYFLNINMFYFYFFSFTQFYLFFVLKRSYLMSNWPLANFVFGFFIFIFLILYIVLLQKYLKLDFIILTNIIFIIILKIFFWRNDRAFKFD